MMEIRLGDVVSFTYKDKPEVRTGVVMTNMHGQLGIHDKTRQAYRQFVIAKMQNLTVLPGVGSAAEIEDFA